jgi:hypothetical protein
MGKRIIIAFLIIMSATISNCYKSKDSEDNIKNNELKKDHKKVILPKWVQYERKPIDKIEAQKPYKGCYFEIHNNTFYYYKNDTLQYIDEFVNDAKLNRTLFKKHNLDEVIFDKDSIKVVLKRDNYEGEYEYFIKDR